MTEFFPSSLIPEQLSNFSGSACKIHYGYFHATPGSYSIRFMQSNRILQQMKEEFDREKAEIRRRRREAGLPEEEPEEEDTDENNNSLDAEEKKRRGLLKKAFLFTVFVAPEIVEEQFVISPLLLLPFISLSPIVVQILWLARIFVLIFPVLRWMELYIYGIPVTPSWNIFNSLISPLALIGSKPHQFTSISSFLTEALLPSFTNIEIFTPFLLLFISIFLPFAAASRRRRGLEDEGRFHFIWMCVVLIFLVFSGTKRFLLSLFAATDFESSFAGLGASMLFLFVFFYSRSTLRRTIKQEEELEKEKRKKREAEDRERIIKRLTQEREKQQKKSNKKNSGKEDDIQRQADALQKRSRLLEQKLRSIPNLQSMIGQFSIDDFVQRFAGTEALLNVADKLPESPAPASDSKQKTKDSTAAGNPRKRKQKQEASSTTTYAPTSQTAGNAQNKKQKQKTSKASASSSTATKQAPNIYTQTPASTSQTPSTSKPLLPSSLSDPMGIGQPD